jgi:hypothetical protein
MKSLTFFDVLAIVFFSVWFVATAVRQMHIEPSRSSLARLEILSFLSWIIPVWHFFAPTPGNYNIYLLYRDQFLDGSLSSWRELPVVTKAQLPRFLWNPNKLRSKAIIDIANELSLTASMFSSHLEHMALSTPYLMLLNYVTSLPRWSKSVATQFVVIKKTREQTSLIILSGLHKIE